MNELIIKAASELLYAAMMESALRESGAVEVVCRIPIEAWPVGKHRDCARIIAMLAAAGETVDTVSVYELAAQTHPLARAVEISGIDAPDIPTNLESRERVILDAYQRATLADKAKLVAASAQDPTASPEELRALVADTEMASVMPVPEQIRDGSGLEHRFRRMASGDFRSVSFPWGRLTTCTQALLPETVTVLCGSPGATKSFALLQALAHWRELGIPAAIYELEDSLEFHLQRAVAQRTGNRDIMDPEWHAANPIDATAVLEAHREFVYGLAQCIWVAPSKPPTLADLAEWAVARCHQGCRIVAIDPISVADGGTRPWDAASDFMQRVKAAARRAGSSVILISHTKKNVKGEWDTSEMAGGAAFGRQAHTVMFLEAHDPVVLDIAHGNGGREVSANRTVHVAKARNASGQGQRIAFSFDGQTLRLEELGFIRTAKQRDRQETRSRSWTPKTASPPRPAQTQIPEEQPFDDGDEPW